VALTTRTQQGQLAFLYECKAFVNSCRLGLRVRAATGTVAYVCVCPDGRHAPQEVDRDETATLLLGWEGAVAAFLTAKVRGRTERV
jgi:hypothetical protein